jgi:hypothetical protein
MIERRDGDSNICATSCSTFFQRSANIFYSDIGKSNKKMLKHKKVQCEIGTGCSDITSYSPATTTAKNQRLEILKMIKLLRLLFRQLKQ